MYFKKHLSCGIEVIAEKLDNFRSCTLGVWVRAGSTTETEEENGVSHFIEHMLFKGTEKRSAKQIAIDTDNIGGQVNAFTSKECTCYYIKAIDEKLEAAVELLSDIFLHATIDGEELENERGVILEEIAMYNDTPDEVAHEIVSSAFFTGTPLQKTILGPAENIRRFTREDLLAYKQKHYGVNNIVIAVAGHFDEQQLFDLLERYFCTDCLQKVSPVLQDLSSFTPQKHEVSAFRDIEQAHLCISLPGFSLKDNRRYALSILNNLIGGSMSSLLFQSVREERGLAYSVYSYPSSYATTGMFTVYAGTTLQNLGTVEQVIRTEMQKLRREKVTSGVFEQNKEQLKGSYVLALESTSARMNSIGKAVLLTGEVKTDDEVLALIDRVKIEECNALLEELCDFDVATTAVVSAQK